MSYLPTIIRIVKSPTFPNYWKILSQKINPLKLIVGSQIDTKEENCNLSS